MKQRTYSIILILLIIIARFININASLQTSILTYRTISVQPTGVNETLENISNFGANPITSIYDPVNQSQIDINRFNQYTVEELIHFNGIGEKTAMAILSYREEHGNFKSFEDLISVKGIGQKKLEQLLNGK